MYKDIIDQFVTQYTAYWKFRAIFSKMNCTFLTYIHVTGQPSDGPMGISVALSPATTTVTTVNKSMITNASFRTKKLPGKSWIKIPVLSLVYFAYFLHVLLVIRFNCVCTDINILVTCGSSNHLAVSSA